MNEGVPKHVAIIMDGNGRWAKKRNLPRTSGHIEGVKRVEDIVRVAGKMGVSVLTIFAFSTENWTRPRTEVSMLMRTLIAVLNKKIRELSKANVKLKFIGNREGVSAAVLKAIDTAMELTKDNTGLILNIAFNYGGRSEILNAIQRIAADVKNNKLNINNITEESVNEALYTRGLPDPDLLIRTSGEQRISNFLLWQLSYAELYFTEKFWPDFTEDEFKKAIEEFQSRERRYGNITAKA